MSEVGQTVLTTAVVIVAFEVLEAWLGRGPTITIAIAAMAFLVSALWEGGRNRREKMND